MPNKSGGGFDASRNKGRERLDTKDAFRLVFTWSDVRYL